MAGQEFRSGSIDTDDDALVAVPHPHRLRAQSDRRQRGIAATSTMILRPRIDALASSLVDEAPS